MGIENNITATKFPRQQEWLNLEVTVWFHYNSRNAIPGIVVRCDAESPWTTIIELANGRFVLASECQFHLMGRKKRT